MSEEGEAVKVANSYAAQGVQSLAGQGLQNMASQGLQNMASQGLPSVAKQGLQSVAKQGLQGVAKQEAQVVAKQGAATGGPEGEGLVGTVLGAGTHVLTLAHQLLERVKAEGAWGQVQHALSTRPARVLASGMVTGVVFLIFWRIYRRFFPRKGRDDGAPAPAASQGDSSEVGPWTHYYSYAMLDEAEARRAKDKASLLMGVPPPGLPFHSLPHKIQVRIADPPAGKKPEPDSLCKTPATGPTQLQAATLADPRFPLDAQREASEYDVGCADGSLFGACAAMTGPAGLEGRVSGGAYGDGGQADGLAAPALQRQVLASSHGAGDQALATGSSPGDFRAHAVLLSCPHYDVIERQVTYRAADPFESRAMNSVLHRGASPSVPCCGCPTCHTQTTAHLQCPVHTGSACMTHTPAAEFRPPLQEERLGACLQAGVGSISAADLSAGSPPYHRARDAPLLGLPRPAACRWRPEAPTENSRPVDNPSSPNTSYGEESVGDASIFADFRREQGAAWTSAEVEGRGQGHADSSWRASPALQRGPAPPRPHRRPGHAHPAPAPCPSRAPRRSLAAHPSRMVRARPEGSYCPQSQRPLSSHPPPRSRPHPHPVECPECGCWGRPQNASAGRHSISYQQVSWCS